MTLTGDKHQGQGKAASKAGEVGRTTASVSEAIWAESNPREKQLWRPQLASPADLQDDFQISSPVKFNMSDSGCSILHMRVTYFLSGP